MNVVVLQGTLSRDPQERVLPSGGAVVEYEVRFQLDERRTETVPVVWYDGPPRAAALASGTEVVVVGRVRRRFFRSGGATQARTEVVAETVVSSRSRRRVQAALDRAQLEVDQVRSA